MDLRNLFKKKNDTPIQIEPNQPAPVDVVDHGEDRPVETPEKRVYPISVGEFFPLKGFMFQVTNVNDHGFTSRVCGVTKSREKEYREYKKKLQEKNKNDQAGGVGNA